MKITWKLTLFSTLIVSLVTLSMVFTLYETMKKSLIDSHKRHILSVVRVYARRGIYPGAKKLFLVFNGKVISDPFGISGKIPYRDGIYNVDGEYYIGVSVKIGLKEIFAASYATPAIRGIQAMSRKLISFSLLGIAASFFTSLVMANFFLSPLRKILKDIKSISASNLERRLESSRSGDEIDELVKELNSMLDRLERAYKAQERFVHDVSHELKNPLSSMKGFIGVLKRWGKKDEELFKESVDEIEKSIDEMRNIIDNLLNLSKESPFKKEKIDVRRIVMDVVRDLEKNYSGRRIEIVGNTKVMANSDYLKIILRNLIDNALKYSNDDVKIVIEKDCLKVIDKGEGIPKSEIDKIFDKFYRIDRSRDRRREGHGIGLSVVKELADKMGMKVEVESTLGKGSIFKLIWREKA